MGDKFKLVLKIEEVMTTKFFDGKSMEDILDDNSRLFEKL